MKDLKEVLNYELENMQVTEKLKTKTLEKCKKSDKKLYLRTMAVKVASVILVISVGYYYGFYNEIPKNYTKVNPINNNLNKDIKIDKDDIKKNSEEVVVNKNYPKINIINEKQSPSKSGLSNSKKAVKSPNEEKTSSTMALKKEEVDKNILRNKNIEDKNKGVDTSVIATSAGNIAPTFNCTGFNLVETEKSLNMKITLPSYVPEGYKILNIRKTTDKNATIIINYSSNLSYFYIKESKDDNLDKNNKTEKNITEENNEISITWTENQVIYSISGNLSKDIIESIANSMK